MDPTLPRTTPPPCAARTFAEWPTWLLVASVYGGWSAAFLQADALPWGTGHAALVFFCAWYMSLQHELLHGHPTRSARLNRWLGLAPLALWYPYDIYRDSHIAHHRDDFLTHPGVDPESNYVRAAEFARLPRWVRQARVWQRTALGRVLLGPAFVIVPTWLDIVRKPLRGDFSETATWAQHLALLAALLWALDRFAGIGPLTYALLIAYPALGLAMLRSFYEHRPSAHPAHRVVVNEAAWPWRLLYLNNNYHAVHHEAPSLPWYRLRRAYLADRAGYLRRNGGFLVPGYGHLLRRFAWRPIDSPILHDPADPDL